LAALAVECRIALEELQVQGFPLQFFFELLRYSNGGAAPKDLSVKLSEMQFAASNLDKQAKNTEAELKKNIEGHSQVVAKFIEDGKANLDAYKKSLSEDIKTKGSSALWVERARLVSSGSAILVSGFCGTIINRNLLLRAASFRI